MELSDSNDFFNENNERYLNMPASPVDPGSIAKVIRVYFLSLAFTISLGFIWKFSAI